MRWLFVFKSEIFLNIYVVFLKACFPWIHKSLKWMPSKMRFFAGNSGFNYFASFLYPPAVHLPE